MAKKRLPPLGKRILPVNELDEIRKINRRYPDDRVTALLGHIDGMDDFVGRLMYGYDEVTLAFLAFPTDDKKDT